MPMEVVVVPHDPNWVSMFNAESRLILDALGGNAIAAHHIGSTAIPAVLAKPIIDMLIVVADISLVDECNGNMQKLGYEVLGEYGIPTRRYFRKDNSSGTRTHHAHVFPHGSSHVNRHIAFRDFLNSHPEWAAKYSDLKCELVVKHADSFERYHYGKSEFIKAIDELAANWINGEPSGERETPESLRR